MDSGSDSASGIRKLSKTGMMLQADASAQATSLWIQSLCSSSLKQRSRAPKKGEKNNHHQTGRGGVGQLDHRALGLATFGSGKTYKKQFTGESRKEFSTIVKLVAPNDS